MITIHILSPIANHRHNASRQSLEKTLQYLGNNFNVSTWEVFGRSEVARARNHVATAAYPHVLEDDIVFWFDADMVVQPLHFVKHLNLVLELQMAISGRYVRRQDATRIAASIDVKEARKAITKNSTEYGDVILHPILAGMGCLMMPGDLFLDQADNSPKGKIDTRSNEQFCERIVCSCPVVKTDDGDFALLSEDFDYCNRIPNGAWMVEFKDGSSIEYGHIAEKILWPNSKVTFVNDK